MLTLVSSSQQAFPSSPSDNPQALLDHQSLFEDFFQSQRIRNFSPVTIYKQRSFLKSWFTAHGSMFRILYTWEAMAPIEGRKMMRNYSATLIDSGISPTTIRLYLGILNRYFSYVIKHPFIHTPEGPRRIQDLYGPIEHPITEYDIPNHVYDDEQRGIPLDPGRIHELYTHLQQHYLNPAGSFRSLRARNYTMFVLAAESGLRIDEIMHLEISKDLFFESNKLQTRFAKSTHGSGKRARLTLFTPLARDTVKFYLKTNRPFISGSNKTGLLFPSKTGKRMTSSAIHTALAEMIITARKSGFEIASHMSWHWARRIFATRFIERFPDKLSVLIQLLGHQNPNTVHRYIRHSQAWMDQEVRSVLERIHTWPSTGD